MATILLIIIYLAFISLGLPDSLLGSAWPVMNQELQVPLSGAGMLSMIVTGGTILSSFLSGVCIRRFGTGMVTFVSVLMTAVALLGFSLAPSFLWLCIPAVPLGLGAGAVDAALNNFVALHYKVSHMNWLHCFWGLGAMSGPMIISVFLQEENGWRKGYRTIFGIQFALVLILFGTLFLWKNFENKDMVGGDEKPTGEKIRVLKLPGAVLAWLAFFCYCGAELTAGLWGSSYLVKVKGISAGTAARWISLFYLGITLGRFLCGFLAVRFQNRSLVRLGLGVCLAGCLLLLLPLPAAVSMPGFVLFGLGCAPVFPGLLHETPARFGKETSQAMMGTQMAFGYIGSTLLPPLFGLAAQAGFIRLFPWFLLLLTGGIILSSEGVDVRTARRQ